jgi:squalene synthase HpnC
MVSLSESYAYCTALAKSHYENFPVGLLVPAEMKAHVHAVYAFARIADDFADEGYTSEPSKPVTTPTEPKTESERLTALNDWEDQLLHPERSNCHPIFPAVHDSIQKLKLSPTLFTDLLSAFKQDVVKRRYDNFDQVLDYCRRSANPVGRLVLHLHGYHDPLKLAWSDHICTALQLANFWQDVSVDLLKDRIYLPLEDLQKFGLTEKELFEKKEDESYQKLLRFQVDRAQSIFDQGAPLYQSLPFPLWWEIKFTWQGGTAILQKIRELDYKTLTTRPKLSKVDFFQLAFRSLLP